VAVDLVWQATVAERPIAQETDIIEAGRAVSGGLAVAAAVVAAAAIVAAAVAEIAFARRGHLGRTAAGRQGERAGRHGEQGLEATVHRHSTGLVKGCDSGRLIRRG